MEVLEPHGMYQAYKHTELTEKAIGVFFQVYSVLGYGFLEKVYENAFAIRLRANDLAVAQQRPIAVHFDGWVVGEYFADLVINDLVLLELKAVRELTEEHEAQLLNYLRATEYEVGLLMNFGPKPRIIRKAFDNEHKPNLKRNPVYPSNQRHQR